MLDFIHLWILKERDGKRKRLIAISSWGTEKRIFIDWLGRDCARKDVQYVGVINDQDTNILISEESLLRNRKECFGELMNEEN